jgi:hypothetical protein
MKPMQFDGVRRHSRLSICGSESCFAAGNDQSARTEDDAAIRYDEFVWCKVRANARPCPLGLC